MSRVLQGGLLLLALLAPAAGFAQSTGGGGYGGGGVGWAGEAAPRGPWAPMRDGAFAEADVARIEARLREITTYCRWLGSGYEASCLADQYGQMRRWLPQNNAYAPLRQALWQAERNMDEVVRRHGVAGEAAVRPNRRGNPTGLSASRALSRTQGAAAARAARAVVDQTATVLLRSTPASDPRRLAFQRVAVALGTNKVILRS